LQFWKTHDKNNRVPPKKKIEKSALAIYNTFYRQLKEEYEALISPKQQTEIPIEATLWSAINCLERNLQLLKQAQSQHPDKTPFMIKVRGKLVRGRMGPVKMEEWSYKKSISIAEQM
jgi:hypothetical protein